MLKRLLSISLCLLILVYVLIRNLSVDFTFDEIWTLSAFVPLPLTAIVSLTPCDANNHILNTLLVKFFTSLLGSSPFVCRLPNFLALILYLLVIYRMQRMFTCWTAYILLLLLLLANPFVLDFFSLARGYGLAMSFELTAIYCMLMWMREHHIRYVSAGVISSMLAVLSNFSFLPFLLVYSAILVLMLSYRWYASRRLTVTVIAGYMVFGLSILPLLLRLKSSGSLYYGGYTGFYADTFTSLFMYSSGRRFALGALALPLAMVVILLLGLTVAALIQSIVGHRFRSEAFLSVAMLYAVAALVWLIQLLMKTPYPIDRTALFLYPLIATAVGFALDAVMPLSPKFLGAITGVAGIALILNFGANANLHKTVFWNFEGYATECLKYINARGSSDHKKYSLDCSWPVEKQIRYYLEHHTYSYIYPLPVKRNRDSLATGADFYILMSDPMPQVGYDPQEGRVRSSFPHEELNEAADHIWMLRK